MPRTTHARGTSRAASSARRQVLTQLKDDHERVRNAYREFQKLDPDEDARSRDDIAQQVIGELSVHAALEEELLYPAARGAMAADKDLFDEAEVEHESMHTFIGQLRNMSADNEKYAARFTVLCEYVLHHVKEEEGEMFPQLERASLDWEALAAQMSQRRQELAPVPEDSGTDGDDAPMMQSDEDQDADPVGDGHASRRQTGAPPRRPSAPHRSS